MSLLLRVFLLMAATGVFNVPAPDATRGVSRSRPVTGPPAQAQRFVESQAEFYMTDDGIAYIRPGLKITVVSVTDVEPGKKPVVELKFTDDMNQPLDRLGQTTPGAISASMILAWYNPETREYTAYTTRTQTAPATSPRPGAREVQASADSGGRWTDLETGRSKYTFNTAIPANADVSKTHTLGIYSTRNLTAIINKNYYANVEHDFRPDGAAVTAKWDKVRDAASCLNCHDPLALHGGSRRDVKLCVLCHSTQTKDPDTGNSVDMALMTHKIHRGHNLTQPYIIIGNANSLHDYSHVTYPQDIRNCQNCHVGDTANNVPAQNDLWLTQPSRRACGACHDSVNWVSGEGHAAGPQANDTACATCHVPDSGVEFDASIKGAHVIPEKSSQLKGLKVAIVDVKDLAATKKPTVTFKITNNDGTAVDGSKLNSFSPIVAGPTSSYTKYYREAGAARAVFDAATGNTTYTFQAALPADAKGTWTVSGDFYRNVNIKNASGPDISVRECATNPQKYIALTGSVTPRRTIVTMAQCNQCHDRLALHGGQRLTIEECVICHNPVTDDTARRPAGNGDAESISMQRMIHRIHRGHALTQDLTIFGNGNVAHNYNEVTYPGDLRNCAVCHTANSHRLPSEGDNVITTRDYFSPQGPGTAACLGCHDNKDAAAHAMLNTATLRGESAEACATCHGPNSEWSTDKVHAR
jgi:OmcA/MtrC family decaheme c-type cytochrome